MQAICLLWFSDQLLVFRYLEAKKNKSKKGKKEDNVDDFPGREKIRFGEVVQAPPKLVAPKVML